MDSIIRHSVNIGVVKEDYKEKRVYTGVGITRACNRERVQGQRSQLQRSPPSKIKSAPASPGIQTHPTKHEDSVAQTWAEKKLAFGKSDPAKTEEQNWYNDWLDDSIRFRIRQT